MINDIEIGAQITCFLAGFGCTAALAVPYIVMHYARKAAYAGIAGHD
jgi:hypothetical protein